VRGLIQTLPDQSPTIQIAILQALQEFRPEAGGRPVVALISESTDPRVRREALRTAMTYPMHDAADLLVELVLLNSNDDMGGGFSLSRDAARALLDVQDPQVVPQLMDALACADAETRGLVAQTLSRTTGRPLEIDWVRHRIDASRGPRQWLAGGCRTFPETWLAHAFSECGVESKLTAQASGESLRGLVGWLDREEPYGYLAVHTLSSLTGQWPPPADWSVDRQRNYWLGLIDRIQR
jgi:hypothetical protein